MRTRVLILAPAGRDAPLIQSALAPAQITSAICADVEELCAQLEAGAGTALITGEALKNGHLARLDQWVRAQPSWSDFPFLVLVGRGSPALDGWQESGPIKSTANVTFLERPVHSATLISAVRAALRARGRQYEVQDYLQALADSEQRYRTLAEALPQLVWTSQPDGQCDYLSSQWEAYTGRPASEHLGNQWLSAVHSDDRDRVATAWNAAVTRGGDYNVEFRLRRADGEYGSFQSRGTPIRDAAGKVVKWFGTCTDISEIVAARELSEQSQAHLERLVEARTRSLAEANDRLIKEIGEREKAEGALRQAQKLESIGQLTSGVAHDFNNLLTAVLGNIQIAQRRIVDEAAGRALRAASHAVERGAKLTSQLLAYSRKQRLAAKPVDINRLVSDARELLFRALGALIGIETRLTPGLWPAMVDPNQMELVLLNLAINGRDAMPGGGRLTIHTANVTGNERPDGLPPGDYVLVSVADTGSGMSEEVRAKAFEPFFTTKEVGKGSGLGLSMVHGLAVQSGGNVFIDSRLGYGTTVRVYLPRAAAEPAVAAPQPTTSVPRGPAATILVVDDDPDVRDIAVHGLREFGYRVVEAASGSAALELLGTNGPVDLVLIDVAMPGMNGIETIRRARQQLPQLKALFVSGYADTTAIAPIGDDPLLQKPYVLDKLATAIDTALRMSPPAGGVLPPELPATAGARTANSRPS